MSHSIITLKLILATVGIIDRLNVCHSTPVKKWTGVPWSNMLVFTPSARQAECNIILSNWCRMPQTFPLLADTSCLHPGSSALLRINNSVVLEDFKMPKWLYSSQMKLSLLNNELWLPDSCQVPSRFWQDMKQVPGRREPRLRLKPIHRHSKRLSESTAQVPLTRAFI